MKIGCISSKICADWTNDAVLVFKTRDKENTFLV